MKSQKEGEEAEEFTGVRMVTLERIFFIFFLFFIFCEEEFIGVRMVTLERIISTLLGTRIKLIGDWRCLTVVNYSRSYGYSRGEQQGLITVFVFLTALLVFLSIL